MIGIINSALLAYAVIISNQSLKRIHLYKGYVVVTFDDTHFLNPPRCASFIVTIYGDVVEPRGGVLWMGNLIDLCKAVNLNESLVRTSVSRLVGANQLEGSRFGRKSYYRLQETTRDEYRLVAQSLFNPPAPSQEFLLIARRDLEADQALIDRGFTVLNRHMLMGAPYGDFNGEDFDGLVFKAEIIKDTHRLPEFAASFWDIDALESRYRAFYQHYNSVLNDEFIAQLNGLNSLIARLALVHDLRHILRDDPHLPKAALPQNWAGYIAHQLFARLYLALTPKAEDEIAKTLMGESGNLAKTSEISERRNKNLQKFLNRDK